MPGVANGKTEHRALLGERSIAGHLRPECHRARTPTHRAWQLRGRVQPAIQPQGLAPSALRPCGSSARCLLDSDVATGFRVRDRTHNVAFSLVEGPPHVI